MKKIYHILGFGLVIGLVILLYNTQSNRTDLVQCPIAHRSPTSEKTNQPLPSPTHPLYTVHTFDLAGKLQGLSVKQIKEHQTLYEGYVKKRNEIAESLKSVDRAGQNRTYSLFRELKVEETYAVNGSILHELYFENIGINSTNPGPAAQKLIDNSFGSLENFKKDLMDCAQCSRGWVLTAYSLDDKRLHNFVCEQHNQNIPVLALPLLVLDVYEHAYMIDFGIKRDPYLDVFWDHIQWNVVEQRIEKWVKPLE